MSLTASTPTQPRVSRRCLQELTDLVVRCGRGDEAAMADLFDLTYFMIAATVTSGVAALPGSDEVIEVYWRIWRHSPAYPASDQPVLSWIFSQIFGQVLGEEASAPDRGHQQTELIA